MDDGKLVIIQEEDNWILMVIKVYGFDDEFPIFMEEVKKDWKDGWQVGDLDSFILSALQDSKYKFEEVNWYEVQTNY